MYVKYDIGLVQSGDPLSLVELKFMSFSVIWNTLLDLGSVFYVSPSLEPSD